MHRLLRSIALAITLAAAGGLAARADDSTKPFTVVLIPDTQLYSEKHPDSYVAQTMWIRQRVNLDNMKFAIHLGDIVQNAEQEIEWKNAARAMEILDGVLPYSMVPGNHDMVSRDGALTRNTELYNRFFPHARYAGQPWYGGHFGTLNDSNYCVFTGGGLKLMVLSLEFAPRDEVLQWAHRVIAAHPDHHVIVATHNYLTKKGRDSRAPLSYKLEGNSGEQMWEKLIRKQPQIFLVVSGHVLGVGLQTSTNDAGGRVYEILTDYQGLPNGGDGWLRTLKFDPGKRKIAVDVYSPVLKKHDPAPEQTYELEYPQRLATRE